MEVAEFLLENGADVNAQDKGGLIPLHNASSYGVCILVFTTVELCQNLSFFSFYFIEWSYLEFEAVAIVHNALFLSTFSSS